MPEAEEAVLSEAARELENNARAIVPVRTGYLRSSISHFRENARRYIVEAAAHYAAYVEFGTRYMAAQPYMRPALERVDWQAIYKRVLARLGL
ncbi:MAG: HK97 gp10 family phage protein [Anaerolineae bacterium]|nr:HK97 gp10 family phage protein [Anaerolineae bacterium]